MTGHRERTSRRGAIKERQGRSASARINFPDPEFISSISTQIEAHTLWNGLVSCQMHSNVHLSLPSSCTRYKWPAHCRLRAPSPSVLHVEHSSRGQLSISYTLGFYFILLPYSPFLRTGEGGDTTGRVQQRSEPPHMTDRLAVC